MPEELDPSSGAAGAGIRTEIDQEIKNRAAGKSPPFASGMGNPRDGSAGEKFELDHDQLAQIVSNLAWDNQSITGDRVRLSDADWLAVAPAGDVISDEYATTLRRTLLEFQRHNGAMDSYCATSVDKLAAILGGYTTNDQISAFQFFSI